MKKVSVTVAELISHLQTFPDQDLEVFIVNEHAEALPIVQLGENSVLVDGDEEHRRCILLIPAGSPSIDDIEGLAKPN